MTSEEPLRITLKRKPKEPETDNEKIILSALRRVAERNTENLNVHIIYAGEYNLDWIEWEGDLLHRIWDTGLDSPLITFIYMYRDSLITKEKNKLICSGKGYRQKDHETPTGGTTYDNSVADDLELFYEDILLGKRPLSLSWTYFSPELTLKEMELVENKDEEFMRSFKLLNNADVNESEMRLSSSTSKYVSAYCRRKTIAIDKLHYYTYSQYPTHYPVRDIKDKLLFDNWFYNNENQGFDYLCFEKLVQAGWEGGIERLRELNKWLIEDLLRVTLTPDDYQTKLRQTQPKYIFIKPESLCNADPRWEIHYHEFQPKYDKIKKEFKPDRPNNKTKKFDENNRPLRKVWPENPDQLLIYEVNGLFVHENLLIAPEEIENFRAVNMKNQGELNRANIISYYEGTLVRQL